MPTTIRSGGGRLGLSWLYSAVAALGADRRTLHDEWSQTVLLPPATEPPRS